VAVPPLALPDAQQSSLEELAQSEAVRLFAARAREVDGAFAMTAANARAVAEICVRLDGLPLAIELAVARSKVLTPAALLSRLTNRLDLLTGGSRDLATRQQTLRGTIAWSYDLLDAKERVLFARLGVFVGGASLAAAEAIVSGAQQRAMGAALPSQPSLAALELDLLDGLSSLVDKSLLRQFEASDGEPRFSMLETIRDYATERLIESDEYEPLRSAHAQYFLALAEQAEPELTGPRQAEWLERLEGEHDNVRSALGWAREQNAAETALRMAGALWRFWYTRGYLSEGRRWLDQALAMVENGLPVLHAEAGASRPADAQMQKTSMAVRAKALTGAGGLAYAQGDYSPAQTCYEASLALFRALGDRRGIASSTNVLGVLAEILEDSTRANSLYQEALALFRELGDRVNVARILNNLGAAAHDRGDSAQAQAFYEESLALRKVLGDKMGIAKSLFNLGEEAQSQGKSVEAIGRYVESLAMRAELGDKEGIAYCLEGLADVAGARGQPKRAARLWGAAAALRENIGAPLPPLEREKYERTVAAARTQYEAAAFDAAFLAGQSMTLEQVAAEAKALVTIRPSDTTNKERITSALPVESPEETGPRLIVAAGTAPRVIPLNRLPQTIGREGNTDIALDDPRVSRQHARLSYRQQQIWLTDLQSSNGTFVNGQPIHERALQPGDLLSFGGMEATFEDPEAGTRGIQVADVGDQVGYDPSS
jgi:predicted ATPase